MSIASRIVILVFLYSCTYDRELYDLKPINYICSTTKKKVQLCRNILKNNCVNPSNENIEEDGDRVTITILCPRGGSHVSPSPSVTSNK